MRVIRAQVFDPIFHPGGTEYPPRLEILVEGIDLDGHDTVSTAPDPRIGEWTIGHYGEFLLFWHTGDLGTKRVHDAHTDEDIETFHEGWFNTSGAVSEPVFPVTVAVDTPGVPWREMFAPVSLVRHWLDEYAPGDARGRWQLRPAERWADRCQIVYELHYVPWRFEEYAAGARAQAARKPRK